MKKAKFFVLILLTFFVSGFFLFSPVSVSQAAGPFAPENQTGVEEVGKEAYGESGEPQDVRQTVAQIIKIVLGFLAIIFVVLIIWGGFEWMTAGGNEEQVSQAKKRLKNGIIGLIIILIAYGITDFVMEYLPEAASDDPWP